MERSEAITQLENEVSSQEGSNVPRYTLTHTKELYKSLSTVGEFHAYIWFREEEYDEDRAEGTRDVIIYGTPELMEVVDDLLEQETIDKFVCNINAILINPEYRPNGVPITSNRDIRDCVRWITPLAARFNGDLNKIWIYNPDTDEYFHTNYNALSATMDVESTPQSYEDTFNQEAYGSISISYAKMFSSGAIQMSGLINTFGAGNKISDYYRGKGIVNISQNNGVPTGGTIKFSDFRNVANGVVATASGNFTHLRAKQDAFGDSLYASGLPKTLNFNGSAGSNDGNPAIRFNNSAGGGTLTVNMNGNAWGKPGNFPGAAMNGEPGAHVATPVKINSKNNIQGGGGGGGKGGNGGKGGGGGHSGTQKCNKWFCKNTKRKCRKDGGNGGNGGNGGAGGVGRGYRWNGSSWYDTNGERSGQGGNSGNGGNKNGGKGGKGGKGGQGGNFASQGNTGQAGEKGKSGGGDEEGCGYNGNKNGQSGQGGQGGGAGGAKYTYSHNGNVS
tara:strand:- start:1004 stop:2509 length:1506 start_codon:yes stop_codon:yes gene_type:complete